MTEYSMKTLRLEGALLFALLSKYGGIRVRCRGVMLQGIISSDYIFCLKFDQQSNQRIFSCINSFSVWRIDLLLKIKREVVRELLDE